MRKYLVHYDGRYRQRSARFATEESAREAIELFLDSDNGRGRNAELIGYGDDGSVLFGYVAVRIGRETVCDVYLDMRGETDGK